MKKYDLYLFDFDGTLLDTEPALAYVFKTGYEHFGIHFDEKDTLEFARMPLEQGYKRLGGDMSKFIAFCDYIHDVLDHHEALINNHLFPDTKEFFELLKKSGVRAGIVTSNKVSHVKEVLEAMDLPYDAFDIFIGNQECHRFKPLPDPILEALKRGNYKGDLSKVVYVGDGINDTLSANAAGVDAVLIDRVDAFPDSDKYVRLHSLTELFD